MSYRNINLVGAAPNVVGTTAIANGDGIHTFQLGAVWDRSPTPGLSLPISAELWADPASPPAGTATVLSIVATENGPGELATVALTVEIQGSAPGDLWAIRLINGEGAGTILGNLNVGPVPSDVLLADSVQQLSSFTQATPGVSVGAIGQIRPTGRRYICRQATVGGSIWDPVDGSLFLTDFGVSAGENIDAAMAACLEYAQTTLPDLDLWREVVIPGALYEFSATWEIYNPIKIRGQVVDGRWNSALGTVLRWTGGAAPYVTVGGTAQSRVTEAGRFAVEGVQLQNLVFADDGIGPRGLGVLLDGSTVDVADRAFARDIELVNIAIRGSDGGFLGRGNVFEVKLNGCSAIPFSGDGLNMQSAAANPTPNEPLEWKITGCNLWSSAVGTKAARLRSAFVYGTRFHGPDGIEVIGGCQIMGSVLEATVDKAPGSVGVLVQSVDNQIFLHAVLNYETGVQIGPQGAGSTTGLYGVVQLIQNSDVGIHITEGGTRENTYIECRSFTLITVANIVDDHLAVNGVASVETKMLGRDTTQFEIYRVQLGEGFGYGSSFQNEREYRYIAGVPNVLEMWSRNAGQTFIKRLEVLDRQAVEEWTWTNVVARYPNVIIGDGALTDATVEGRQLVIGSLLTQLSGITLLCDTSAGSKGGLYVTDTANTIRGSFEYQDNLGGTPRWNHRIAGALAWEYFSARIRPVNNGTQDLGGDANRLQRSWHNIAALGTQIVTDTSANIGSSGSVVASHATIGQLTMPVANGNVGLHIEIDIVTGTFVLQQQGTEQINGGTGGTAVNLTAGLYILRCISGSVGAGQWRLHGPIAAVATP